MGSFIVDKIDLSLVPWKKLGVCRVPNGSGFLVSTAPGLKMDSGSVVEVVDVGGVGIPKILPEEREGLLGVGNPKRFGVGVKGLALGLSSVELF